MPKVQLGRIREVSITEVFRSEEEFSNWLLENIEILSEKLQIELDDLQREYQIGRFSADIVGRDVNTNEKVVIENQFGRTDHDHLGKILTYASGIDAKIIVWIAEEFADEHKQALTWLNNQTPAEIGFFGIEVRAIQIENSPYAIDFKVVVAPNQWVKITRISQISPRGEAYREFWRRLLELYGRRLTPQPQNWMSFGAGRSGITYNWVFTYDNKFSVELYINTGDPEKNKQIYECLLKNKEQIERVLNPEGYEMYWGPAKWSPKGAHRIAVYKPMSGDILQIDESEKSELLEWGKEMMKRFETTFSRYLRVCAR